MSTMHKEEIYEKLRQNGCRITEQRKTLVEIILDNECSCCKEIHYQALKKMPNIGLATIYRMLNVLEEIGAIRRANLYHVCRHDRIPEGGCVVELEDRTVLEFDQTTLRRVIESGMVSSGCFESKDVKKVTSIFLK